MMKILLPVDGSPNAERAVSYVINYAAQFSKVPELLLLNVQWNVAAGNVKLFISQETINDYYQEQGLQALAAARTLLDDAHMTYRFHISVGSPAEGIAQFAETEAVDQIIMGRAGQGKLNSMLLGSAVNKVLHLVSCPVTLVK
jgi:nucleotide-binding universal stress UspA family protein